MRFCTLKIANKKIHEIGYSIGKSLAVGPIVFLEVKFQIQRILNFPKSSNKFCEIFNFLKFP